MTRILLFAIVASTVPAGRGTAQTVVDYEQQVKPILTAKCFGCHGPTQQQSGLRLDLRQNALRGGDYGVVIVPGRSADSKLIQRVTGEASGLRMPPTGPLEPEQIDVLRRWIDGGADMPGRASESLVIAKPTDPGVQRFLDAIHRHDAAAVRHALADDASLAGASDSAGATALMHAAYAGTLEIMNSLLAAGADVKAVNQRGATALHWAAMDAAKMKLLLSKGADINARTVEGRTVLHAIALEPAGAPLMKLLIEAGADVNARSLIGQTPLFAAVVSSLTSTELLLEAGADPNLQSELGVTPVMTASVAGAVGALVAGGADVNRRGKKGETAIANAADRGDLEAVKLLLGKGVDVNVPDHRGYTALMLAAHFDRDASEIVDLLLAHGADPRATAENESAFTMAAKRGDSELARTLRTAAAR